MSPELPRLLRQIVGARSDDPEVALRELVLNLAAAGLVLAGLLWLAADFLTSIWNGTLNQDLSAQAGWYVGVGLGVLACAAVYALSRWGRVTAASYLLLAAVFSYTIWRIGIQGIEHSDVALFFLALSLAGLLLGSWGNLITALVGLLAYAVVGQLQATGFHPEPLVSPWLSRVVSFGLLLLLVAAVNWVGGRHLSTALAEARQQAATLRLAREEQALLLTDLQAQTEEQAQLLSAVEDLAAPVITVHDGIIVLPIVGYVDGHRADLIRQALLQGIARHQAAVALLDLTGLQTMNNETVRHLEAMSQAGRLLGTDVVLVSIPARAAAEMIRVGADLETLKTQRNLQSGIEWALAQMARGTR